MIYTKQATHSLRAHLFSVFCNDTATTDIYTYLHTLSLHVALPISGRNWPLAPISKPVGVCIQLLTDSIQKAEMKVPIATAQVAAKCRPLPTLLMPNSM